MTALRHRIRRQLLELTIQGPGGDRDAAWQLQNELARIQKSVLEELLDRCFSEIGSPDRLHRIDSLEVELGELSLENLEHELVKKLEPALRTALSERIREADEQDAARGSEPESSARLELVALFLQSGNLPWWADSSRPRQVDDAIAFLLERQARPLLGLVQALLKDERERRAMGPLLRLVQACTDARLELLVGALLAQAQPALAARLGPVERSQALRQLLEAQPATSGLAATQPRSAVWLGLLRAAGTHETLPDGPIGFWRLALAQLALAANRTYTSLLTALGSRLEPHPTTPLHAIVRTLAGELRGAPATSLSPPSPDAPGAADEPPTAHALAALRALLEELLARASAPPDAADAGKVDDAGNELLALLARLEKLPDPLPAALGELLTRVRAALPELTLAQRRALLAPLQVLQALLAQHAQHESLDAALAAAASAISAHMQAAHPQLQAAPEPSPEPSPEPEPEPGELLASLTRLEQLPSLLPGLFAELFAALRSRLLQAQTEVPNAQLPGLTSLLAQLRALEAQAQAGSLGAPETLPALRHLLATLVSERLLAPATLGRLLALLQQAQTEALLRAAAQAPAGESDPSPPELAYSDSDEVYVENAGLVLLWPFFVHLFERLGLMVEKKFQDAPSLHRAVGLLQHLVTGETEPAEYQLTLPKLLCGMEPGELWSFGAPVTAPESEECANLLTAAILNAPVLGEMSIEGFRTSLLMRKGALSSRDGAWLLRVERLEYDLVLERLPWTLSWIKLPWCAVPIAVEW